MVPFLTCLTFQRWHMTPDRQHLTPIMWLVIFDTWHFTPDTWHLTPKMKPDKEAVLALSVGFTDRWYMTSDIWNLTFYIWNLTPNSWHLTFEIWNMTPLKRHLSSDRWPLSRVCGSCCCFSDMRGWQAPITVKATATDQIYSQMSCVPSKYYVLDVRCHIHLSDVLYARSDLSSVTCHMSENARVRATDLPLPP